jgi:hypothetical protein
MQKMNFKKEVIILSIIFFSLSVAFFAYQESWIIFIVPHKKEVVQLSAETKPAEAVLYFWKYEKWNFEKVSYIKSSDQAQNIKNLAHLYFRLLDDEAVIHNDVSVNSVVLHKNKQIAFISCNQSPFNAQDHTKTKLMIIEGLLKTLRDNNVSTSSIQFLINHQPLTDDHLDFTIPWPLTGYL